MVQPVIQTFGLTKHYSRGKAPALANLNLTVHPGEIFGYLGPNGAGKTTTIRLLLDILRPSSGSAQVFGLDSREKSVEIHRRIGFLPGELNLWDNMTARQVIGYLGGIRGGPDWAYVGQLAERLRFELDKQVRSYSSGNKRKLGLILAMMHKPELLILDEPTNGLDPLMQQIFMEMVEEAKAEGRTVFLSSHMLSEVQAVCDRVAILRDGKLQAVETVENLTRVNFYWVNFTLREAANPALLAGVPGLDSVKAEGRTLRARVTGDIDPVLRALNGQYVVSMATESPSLEEIFLTYYDDVRNGNGKNGRHAGKEGTK